MSITLNGNGKSHLSHAPATQPPKPRDPTLKDGYVTFKTSNNLELRATLTHMTRHSVAFELYNPDSVLATSEVLREFSIHFQGQVVYSGQAVIENLLAAGRSTICKAALNGTHWPSLMPSGLASNDERLGRIFKDFLGEWQNFYKISAEFKAVVADMQTMLRDLQLWLDQMQSEIDGLPIHERTQTESRLLEGFGRLFVPAFDALHERLEELSAGIDPDGRPAHRVCIQRQLHPLVLCSPFAHRAYSKPLGYAGDYEMVNMIALDPFQGSTLFAKIVNLWFLSQWPSKAHRNRLTYLQNLLETETLRVIRNGGKARIFNFACGPALEIQRFVSNFKLIDGTELTLADFSQESLDHLHKLTSAALAKRGARATLHFQKKSVHQLIKESARPEKRAQYDIVYCAGLFDYLPDNTCARMLEIFYDWLAPGGLLAVSNVVDDKPFRHMLEFVLDWHLIYRDVQDSHLIFPDAIPLDSRSVKKDPTGVNIFLEARKPSE